MLVLFAALQTLALNVRARLGREDGGVVIEYGVVVATISLLLIAAGALLVTGVTDWFERIANFVNTLGPAGGGE